MASSTAIPTIVVICYLVVTALKGTGISSRLYPVISCAVGVLAGAVLFRFAPEFIGAAGLAQALVSGAASGLAATGTNQVLKQLLKAAKDGSLKIDSDK